MTNEEAIDVLNNTAWLGTDVGIKVYPAVKMAVEALDKREKYRWHDLRKDPQDYPTKGGYLLLRILIKTLGRETYGVVECWADCEKEKDIDVLAWRYIEPFEEVE